MILSSLIQAENIDSISDVAGLDPTQFLGIPFALIGAALLAFGAQYQSRGLNKVERITGESAGSRISFKQITGLLRRPSWVSGTLMLGLAVVFQLVSLTLSPLILVQPIGVIGLLITSVLNSRLAHIRLGKRVLASIACAVIGVFVFVGVAAFTASSPRVTDTKLTIILIVFAVVLVTVLTMFLLFRNRTVALFYIVGAGMLYGFVATFAKVVIRRLQQGEFEWLTWLCLASIAVGGLLGTLFVQHAYSSGPPDLVVAGLTVIDPIVAVLIGIIVLNEAAGAPLWAAFVFLGSGAIAVTGVLGLAKYHPQSGVKALPEN